MEIRNPTWHPCVLLEGVTPATWEVEGGSMEWGLEVSIQTKFPEWLGLELE